MNRPQLLRRVATRTLVRLALVVAVVGTAAPLARDLAPVPARALEPTVSLPLDGYWQTYANADRILRVRIDGDEVWAATEGGGVVKWNTVTGAHHHYLAPQHGLASNIVRDVAVTVDGSVFAATERGLSRYLAQTDDFETLTPSNSAGMPARVVTALAARPDGKLWVGFGQEWDAVMVDPTSKAPGTFKPGGLALYDAATGAWESVYHVEFEGEWQTPRFKYVPSENVSVLELATDGTLWIGTTPYMVFDPNNCSGDECENVAGYWVPAGGGIAAMKDAQWQNWFPAPEKSGACYPTIVRDMAPDTDGRMWVAGGGELYLMKNGLQRIGCDGQVRYEKAKVKSVGMRGRMVWGVDVDAQGNVWVTQGETFDKGLGLGILNYNGTLDDFGAWDSDDFWEFIDLDAVPGASDVVATALRIRPDGRVVLGTRNHRMGDGDGMRLYDPATASWAAWRTGEDGPPSNQITDVRRNPVNGDLWVSTATHGVARYDGQRWQTWKMFQPGDRVGATTIDARKGIASIQTDIPDQAAFNSYFPTSSSYVRFGDSPTKYRVLGYTPASKAIRFTPGLEAALTAGAAITTVDRGPASDHASQIAIDDAGTVWAGGRETIWLGTCDDYPYCWQDGGIGKWDGTRWTVYDFNTSTTGLSVRDAEVSTVVIDARGRVWAGTGNPFQGQDGKGIFVFDPATSTYSLFDVTTVKSRFFAGDAQSDMDRDPVTGDIWVAHHANEVCANTSPFGGGCTPSFTGGGVSRWNGTEWQKWSKSAGAFLKAAGEDGELWSIAVDRANNRVWAGGYERGANFHWLQGIGVNAVVNWCPLDNCTNEAWRNVVFPDDGVVTAIEDDDTGNVWVGTHRHGNGLIPPVAGVKLFDGTEWHTYTPENTGLPSNEITVLTQDADTMWIGTLKNGISHYYAVPPPTPTPEATNTPRPTHIVTSAATTSPSPTGGPSATLPPGVTPSATPTATAKATQPTGTPDTEPPDECGSGGTCTIVLPFAVQRRACSPNCPTAVPRTATPRTPTVRPATATATMTAPPTATATTAAPPTPVPSDTPVPTDTEVPPEGTPTDTSGPEATPTRTTRPTLTVTPTSTPTATSEAARAWAAFSGGSVPRVAYAGVHGVDATHVWMVGATSKVLFWNGTQLAVQKDTLADDLALKHVHIYYDGRAYKGYIVGNTATAGTGVVYSTRDGGVNWGRMLLTNYTDEWRSVSIASNGAGGWLGWMVGNVNGNRLWWTGTGNDWAPQSPGDRNNRSHEYSDVVVVGPTLAYAISNATTGARIYSWDGTAWSPGPSTAALYDVDVLSSTQGAAVGKGGAVWRLAAGGTWSKMAPGPQTGGQDLYAVHYVADDQIWVAGARGKIFVWNGQSWTDKAPSGQIKAVRGIWLDASGASGWAVGDDGLVLRYQ